MATEPIQVRSIRCAKSDTIEWPIQAAESLGIHAINSGTYLHREDVVALVKQYAQEFVDTPNPPYVTREALEHLADKIATRGV